MTSPLGAMSEYGLSFDIPSPVLRRAEPETEVASQPTSNGRAEIDEVVDLFS
jgi:hypothetical protein